MRSLAPALIALAIAALPGIAAANPNHAHDHGATSRVAAAPSAQPLTLGEVRKVDTAAGKITLKHDAITNLEMPPMTMVFVAKDPALLAKVKAGDKVRFRAESADGTLVVTAIEVVR